MMNRTSTDGRGPNDIEAMIRADADALRESTGQRLSSPADTERALARQTHLTHGARPMKTRNTRWMRIAVVTAVLMAAGVVVAATQTNLFSIWVDTSGKTDQQVENEIEGQLLNQGVTDPEVKYERSGDGDMLEIEGKRGDGEFKVVRHKIGGVGGVIEMSPPELDTEREPGMTDEQLADKIRAQLHALGLEGDVTVDGDRIEISAEKEIEVEGE